MMNIHIAILDHLKKRRRFSQVEGKNPPSGKIKGQEMTGDIKPTPIVHL
jgi:hypothetical protein